MDDEKQLASGSGDEKEMISFFESITSFSKGQRMAQLLAASTIVPKEFQNNIPNTIIALEMANRINASPLAVMQSLYVVHGKPSWSGQFIIAAVNSSGRFRGHLRFDITGDGDDKVCVAYIHAHDGEKLVGAPASIAMAKGEGWYQKNGSKWKTMPELMLRYRAATFFGREHIPDLLMGMQTTEELRDTGSQRAEPVNVGTKEVSLNDVIDADIISNPGQPVSSESTRVAEYKATIDKLETSLKVDQWRAKMSSEIIKMSQADQDAVFIYAEDAYEALKQSEEK